VVPTGPAGTRAAAAGWMVRGSALLLAEPPGGVPRRQRSAWHRGEGRHGSETVEYQTLRCLHSLSAETLCSCQAAGSCKASLPSWHRARLTLRHAGTRPGWHPWGAFAPYHGTSEVRCSMCRCIAYTSHYHPQHLLTGTWVRGGCSPTPAAGPLVGSCRSEAGGAGQATRWHEPAKEGQHGKAAMATRGQS